MHAVWPTLVRNVLYNCSTDRAVVERCKALTCPRRLQRTHSLDTGHACVSARWTPKRVPARSAPRQY